MSQRIVGVWFSGEQLRRIWVPLEARPDIYAKQEAPTGAFVEVVLWSAPVAAVWRLLPLEFGSWNSVYKHFVRWQEKRIWQMLMDRLSADGDVEWLMLDSTVVRAHSCAAGAIKAKETSALAVQGADFSRSCTGSLTASTTPYGSP